MRFAITPSTVSGSPRSPRSAPALTAHTPPAATSTSRASRSAAAISSTNSGLPAARSRISSSTSGASDTAPSRSQASSRASSSPSGVRSSSAAPGSASSCVYSGARLAVGREAISTSTGSSRRTSSRSSAQEAESSHCASSTRQQQRGAGRVAEQREQELARGLDAALVLQRRGLVGVRQVEAEDDVEQRRARPEGADHLPLALAVIGALVDAQQRGEHGAPGVVRGRVLDRVALGDQAAQPAVARQRPGLGQQARLSHARFGLDRDRVPRAGGGLFDGAPDHALLAPAPERRRAERGGRRAPPRGAVGRDRPRLALDRQLDRRAVLDPQMRRLERRGVAQDRDALAAVARGGQARGDVDEVAEDRVLAPDVVADQPAQRAPAWPRRSCRASRAAPASAPPRSPSARRARGRRRGRAAAGRSRPAGSCRGCRRRSGASAPRGARSRPAPRRSAPGSRPGRRRGRGPAGRRRTPSGGAARRSRSRPPRGRARTAGCRARARPPRAARIGGAWATWCARWTAVITCAPPGHGRPSACARSNSQASASTATSPAAACSIASATRSSGVPVRKQ